MEYKPLCETMAQIIKESGLRVSEISRYIGISESTIRRIISGEIEDPRYVTVRDIVRICGGSIDRILGIGIYAPESRADMHECTEISAQECTEDAKMHEIAQECTEDAKMHEIVQECTEHAPMHEDASLHIPDWRTLYTPELAELFADAPMGPVGYERALKYIKQEAADAHAEAAASHAANAHIREQNIELVRMNSGLLEQLSATRSRNRALYAGIIIACIVAGICLSAVVGYVIYDIMSPAWGAVRY